MHPAKRNPDSVWKVTFKAGSPAGADGPEWYIILEELYTRRTVGKGTVEVSAHVEIYLPLTGNPKRDHSSENR